MKSFFKPNFIMLYTGDFVLCCYVQFGHRHMCMYAMLCLKSIHTVCSSYNNDYTQACAYLYHCLILSLEFVSIQINPRYELIASS